MPPELLATTEFVGMAADGTESILCVGVGRPSQEATGEWGCPTLTYDSHEPKQIYGENSFQALCLGLSLIRMELEGWFDRGGRMFVGEPREELTRQDLSAWFGAH